MSLWGEGDVMVGTDMTKGIAGVPENPGFSWQCFVLEPSGTSNRYVICMQYLQICTLEFVPCTPYQNAVRYMHTPWCSEKDKRKGTQVRSIYTLYIYI